MLFHLTELVFEGGDPIADMTAVGFELCLSGTSRADTAAQTGQRGAAAGQPAQAVFVLCECNLHLTFGSSGTSGENVKDEHSAVNNLAVGHVGDIAHLHTGELGVKDQHVGFEKFHLLLDFFKLAGADAGCSFRCRT